MYRSSSKLLIVALMLGLLAAYLAVMLLEGRFVVADEIFFKAAGAQWAETGSFAATEFTGFLGTDPPVERIYALYPPVYPFLFGVLARMAGFSWRCCVFYDALIHVVLAVAVLWYATQLDSRFRGFAGVLLLALVLPLGTPGRPDELAMIFGTLGVCFLAWRGEGMLPAAICGTAVGLAAGTSLGAGAVFGLLALARILCQGEPWQRGAVRCALLFGVSVMTMCVVWLPILAAEPSVLRQFLAHVVYVRRLQQTLPESWRFMWRLGHFDVLIPTLAAAATGLLALAFQSSRGTLRHWCVPWLGPVLALAFIFIALPREYSYLWFVEPALIVASMISLGRLWTSRPAASAVSAFVLLAAIIVGWTPFAMERMKFLQLPEDQAFAVNQAKLRALIPQGSAVLANPDAWLMLRGHCRVYSTWVGSPDPGAVQFLVLSGNGSGVPGRPLRDGCCRIEETKSTFATVYDNLPRNPVYLGPFRVTNSAYGFGQMVRENVSAFPHGSDAAPTEDGRAHSASRGLE